MQNGKKYYLNVSSYKYKREYMKLYQPYIDKILNTYSNRNSDIIVESPNLCPAGKRCKNYIIIMNLEQKIKELNDTMNQLMKIKEYSESNHNIDFTPMKMMENTKKDTFNEICNSFRNSGIKKKLNSSTRNIKVNNTLKPQISEPYRLKLDYKNTDNETRIQDNKKLIQKKLLNLDINKFKNIGVRMNAEKLGTDEKLYLNRSEENNEIKNNNSNYDEKEKKIQNLINHIFNNKNNELVINKKSEEAKNIEINNKKGDTKMIKKLNLPKIKVKSYNLKIPNKVNKMKNKRYTNNSELNENTNKVESKDENNMYFRTFKGIRNSFNSTKRGFLSKSLGFNNNSKEEKNSLFNLTDKSSTNYLDEKKQSIYRLSTLNGLRPLSLTQKPFRLKNNITQNDFMNAQKTKSEREIKKIEGIEQNKEENIVKSKNLEYIDFESFLNLFHNKNDEKLKIFEEIVNLFNQEYEELVEKIKSLSKEKINEYIIFIKYSLIYMKDILEIIHKLKVFYNISSNNNGNNFIKNKNNKFIQSDIIKYKNNIWQVINCDLIHIYLYDSITDNLILKGEKEEMKFPKDKDLIGKCFISGKPINYNMDKNLSIFSDPIFLEQMPINKSDRIFLYPIKDLENHTLGVIEAINHNSDNSNSNSKSIFDKKDEIIMSFISKTLGSFCIYSN